MSSKVAYRLSDRPMEICPSSMIGLLHLIDAFIGSPDQQSGLDLMDRLQ